MERREIASGVFLNVIETTSFKTNDLSLNFLIPLAEDTAAKAALLPSVLRRGTRSWPDMAALERRLDMLYEAEIQPRVFRKGEVQAFGFTLECLDRAYIPDGTDSLDGALDVLYELLYEPRLENGAFLPAYVAGEKNNQIDAIRAEINNKDSYARRRCLALLCQGEAYAVPVQGTEETVRALTPESLYDFYRWVLERVPVELYFVGRPESLPLEKLKKLFSARRAPIDPLPRTQVIRTAGPLREQVEDQPVTQGKLCLGFRSGITAADETYPAFLVFCEIFGGSATSLLFMNVREKLGLCYYCSAIADTQKGVMLVASGIDVANRDKAEKEILHQLETMREGVFSDEDMEAARLSLCDSYRGITDSPSGLEQWYMARLLAGKPLSPAEMMQRVTEVTREQVQQVARGISLEMIYFLRAAMTQEREETEKCR